METAKDGQEENQKRDEQLFHKKAKSVSESLTVDAFDSIVIQDRVSLRTKPCT